MKERYLLPLRILLTLLILTMMLPGWGLLSASHLHEEVMVGTESGTASAAESSTGSVADNLWAPAR
jgi:hypothetical protein